MSELADVLDRLLDADELGSLVGRPARAASVRAKNAKWTSNVPSSQASGPGEETRAWKCSLPSWVIS